MIKKTAKKLIRSIKDKSYHSAHKKSALKILKSIESEKGITDKKLIKLSDEYAQDVLGWKGYAPWLYVYSAMNNEFKEGWIPDNYYGKIVVPILKGKYGNIANYNSLTSRLFNSSNFPDCVYFTNGFWISPEYHVLSDKEVIEIVTRSNEKVVHKIDDSSQGNGVNIIERNSFHIEKVKLMGNGVIQKYINQHKFFKDIIPHSVATLRITSVINEKGVVSVRACYLRVGRSSDTHVKSASQIRIPINMSNGQLYKYGYTTNWLQIVKHPDTEYLFEDKMIPKFDKFIETAINLHKMVPFTRTIGWDMILDVNESVQVMEWNGSHNDIRFSEATQGPCFSDLGFEELWKNVKGIQSN